MCKHQRIQHRVPNTLNETAHDHLLMPKFQMLVRAVTMLCKKKTLVIREVEYTMSNVNLSHADRIDENYQTDRFAVVTCKGDVSFWSNSRNRDEPLPLPFGIHPVNGDNS